MIPNGWQQCVLPDFAHIVMGQSPPSTTYNRSGDGLPFFQGKAEFGDLYPTVNIYCLQPNKIAKQGATLLSVRAPVGPTNLAQQDCCIGRGLAAIHSCGGIAPKFLLYLFRSIEPEISGKGTGSTFKAITKGFVEDLHFGLPPLNEQCRIVAKIEELFSELDKGIESLKAARAKLNIYRQAVLKHAFEGKLTAQWREENKDKLETPEQLLARIKQEREARYEQQLQEWKAAVKEWEEGGKSGRKPAKPKKPGRAKTTTEIASEEVDEFPNIPESWCLVRLCQIAEIGLGISVSAARKPEDPLEVPYLRVANVQRGFLDLSEIKHMSIERSQLDSLQLKKWDVLFNEGGDRDKLGRGWIWQSEIAPCITQNHVFRASPYITSGFNSKLLSYWANTFGQQYFEKVGKQTTNLASINKTVLSKFPVPLIPSEEQEELCKQIDQSMTTIDAQEQEIVRALGLTDLLRQSIIAKAFSGQLVPQDPDDEPASSLLDRIKAEKEKAAQNNHSKKTKKRKTTA